MKRTGPSAEREAWTDVAEAIGRYLHARGYEVESVDSATVQGPYPKSWASPFALVVAFTGTERAHVDVEADGEASRHEESV